jgi:hypothetical protein
MLVHMNESKRTAYDIQVMARLRYPMPVRDEDEWGADEAEEAAWEARQRYAEELSREYEDMVENEYLAAEARDEIPGPPPNLIEAELASVSGQIEALEEYRERLLVFARTLSSDLLSARRLAQCTGLSHSTIVRMATDEAIAEVAAEASVVATETLRDVDRRDDPQLFLRLQGAARMTRESDQ